MFICFPNDGRKLRNVIMAILKSWLTTQVKRLNYVKSYTIADKKMLRQDEKLLRLDIPDWDENKLKNILEKTFPEYKILK